MAGLEFTTPLSINCFVNHKLFYLKKLHRLIRLFLEFNFMFTKIIDCCEILSPANNMFLFFFGKLARTRQFME